MFSQQNCTVLPTAFPSAFGSAGFSGLSYIRDGLVADWSRWLDASTVTLEDKTANGNDATLYTGRYFSTDGVSGKGINAEVTIYEAGQYYLEATIRPKESTIKATIGGSSREFDTGGATGTWQQECATDFANIAFSVGQTEKTINVCVGWDGDTIYSEADWSEIKLINATTGTVVTNWLGADSSAGSLDGHPCLDRVGGFHGTHSGGVSGGTGEGFLPANPEDITGFDITGPTNSGTFTEDGTLNGAKVFKKGNDQFAKNFNGNWDLEREDTWWQQASSDTAIYEYPWEVQEWEVEDGGGTAPEFSNFVGGSPIDLPTIPQTAGMDWNRRMYFDGVDDEVTTSFISFSGEFYIEFKALFSGDTNQGLFGYSVNNDHRITLKPDGTAIFVRISDNTASVPLDAPIEPDRVYTIRITRNGSNVIRATVDGVQQLQTDTRSGTLVLNRIGVTQGGNLNGVIYDVDFNNEHYYQGYGNTNADWEDQIGSNDGTVNGSPSNLLIPESLTTPGVDALGNAIQNPRINNEQLNFFGDGEYAEIADDDSLDLTTEATWEMWGNFYRNSGDPDYVFLSKWDNNIGNHRSWWFRNDDETGVEVFQIGLFPDGSSNTAYNAWFDIPDALCHVAITLSNGVVNAYVNGASVEFNSTQGTPSSVYVSNTNILINGAIPSSPEASENLKSIGSPKIYNRALTADEVLQNFNAQKSKYGL